MKITYRLDQRKGIVAVMCDNVFIRKASIEELLFKLLHKNNNYKGGAN